MRGFIIAGAVGVAVVAIACSSFGGSDDRDADAATPPVGDGGTPETAAPDAGGAADVAPAPTDGSVYIDSGIAPGTEVTTNASFEGTVSCVPFSATGGSAATRPLGGHTGDAYCNVCPVFPTEVTPTEFSLATPVLEDRATPGARFLVSVWTRAGAEFSSLSLRARSWDGEDLGTASENVYDLGPPVSSAPTWVQRQATVIVPEPKVATAEFDVVLAVGLTASSNAASCIDIDDFTVTAE